MEMSNYVYPQDWEPFKGIPADVYRRFGLHYGVGISTPSWLLARTTFVSLHEFSTMNNPLTHARLGDSNSRSVEGLKRILPRFPEEEVKIGERKRFFGLLKEIIYIKLPNPVDYDACQVGDVPIGLSGKFEEGAKVLAKSVPTLEKLALETKQYFDFAKYNPGVRVGIESLGGTQVLNLAFKHLQEVKPAYKIDVWIVDERHPNLKALIAYMLKARKENKDELVILRINKRESLEREDIVLARGINGILSQYGTKGKPDLSTLIRSLIERYDKGIVHYTYKTIDISLIPTKEKMTFLGFTVSQRRGKDLKESEKVIRIVTQALGRMPPPPSDNEHPYFVFGAWTDEEIKGIEIEAKTYIGDDPLFVVPVGSPLRTIDGRTSMRVTIVRFEEGYDKLKALFNYKGSDEIPDEVLEKAIEKNDDVTNGLRMASRFFGLDILDFIRGEK
jgi:hypothetical protein